MSIVQLQGSEIPVCASTAQSCINISSSPMAKGFASDYHLKHHTQAIAFLSLNENARSHAREFLADTTPVLLTPERCSLSVFLAESIGSVQSSVVENPHHSYIPHKRREPEKS